MEAERDQRSGSVDLSDTLVRRRAGASAAEQARTLHPAHPIRSRVDRLLGHRTGERAWRKGATGERVTSFWLGRLPDGWSVFHDIPVGARGANIDHLVIGPGGANIDHLVIGPGGVFTVNTKNLTGTIRLNPRTIQLNGVRTNFLSRSAAEARRAGELLAAAVGRPVEVRGVLAILADEWDIVKEPADVFVRGPRGAKNLMLTQPATLTPGEARELAAAAAKPTTWVGTPGTGSPSAFAS
jgi:Nuclease-related domain